MNKVVLIGRLVADVELRYVGDDNAVSTFTLAVDKYNKKTEQKEADFIRCKVWGKQAENLAQYKQKGDQLGISGRIETGSYEDNDGNKKYTTEVVCNEIEYLASKKEEINENQNSNKNNRNQNSNNKNQRK